MLCLFVYATLCVVRVDLTKTFQTLYTNATETYEVDVRNAETVFFFVQNTAAAVLLTIGYETTPISVTKPYAFAVTQSAGVNVTASVNTSLILMVVKENACENGAFYITGGKSVNVQASRDVSKSERARYCVFSPSTDNQSVSIGFGLRNFSIAYHDNANLVYLKDDGGVGVQSCLSSQGSCGWLGSHAYYYVAYEHGPYSSSRDLLYGRNNKDHEDRYTNCTSRQIPYYPAGSGRLPYDVASKDSWYCHNDEQHEEKKRTDLIIGLVVGAVLAIAGVAILIKTRCCRDTSGCRRTETVTVKDSLLGEHTFRLNGTQQSPGGFHDPSNPNQQYQDRPTVFP